MVSSEQDDKFKFKRRLFCSVDLIGSTNFKYRNSTASSRWSYLFNDFFQEFPSRLLASYDGPDLPADSRPISKMSVWKYIGDEILFEVELFSHGEVLHHVLALRNALNSYTDTLHSKSELLSLGLKGTIWGAGFPISNTEVQCKLESNKGVILRDYLGPCIDQGFRLCGLADARKIPISIDVAFMLAMTALPPKWKLPVHCEEPRLHKGVGSPYPFIWVDRISSGSTLEDSLIGRAQSFEPPKMRDYLYELYSHKSAALRRPFIVTDLSAEFNQVPSDMLAMLAQLRSAQPESSYSSEQVASVGTKSPLPELTKDLLGRVSRRRTTTGKIKRRRS